MWRWTALNGITIARKNSSRIIGAAHEMPFTQIETQGHALFLQAFAGGSVQVAVTAPLRKEVEATMAVFERNLSTSRLPEPQIPKRPKPEIAVFIGHGRSELWRDLKDHLHEQHGYKVVAYEIGARAGHSIRDILEDMLAASSFAILVMTGEDETAEGLLHPRLNVVHEAGLFQGRLGFNRAVVLLEGGAEEFSYIHGLHQIRFSKGNIKEVYGEVLATLRREFT
jgi:predicted nucleotide-binding protein